MFFKSVCIINLSSKIAKGFYIFFFVFSSSLKNKAFDIYIFLLFSENTVSYKTRIIIFLIKIEEEKKPRESCEWFKQKRIITFFF